MSLDHPDLLVPPVTLLNPILHPQLACRCSHSLHLLVLNMFIQRAFSLFLPLTNWSWSDLSNGHVLRCAFLGLSLPLLLLLPVGQAQELDAPVVVLHGHAKIWNENSTLIKCVQIY